MKLFTNKGTKKLIIELLLIFLLAAVFSQVITYINALQFKKYMIEHDSELAGYLSRRHPDLQTESEILSVFTSEKSYEDLLTGKALLEKSGYNNNVQMHLVPYVNIFYKTNIIMHLILIILTGLVIILFTYSFLKKHYKTIDNFTYSVNRIMDGAITTRLEDSEDGSLPKLAASINEMTSSLHAHIEKEKHNRNFLKDIITNVSHQLKTPLSALMMYTEIMKGENSENITITSFLDKSETELERMQTLIAKLLKLARLDAGIIELNKKQHLLIDIIKQAAESFETRLVKENKSFEIKADSKILCLCDKEWMLEALSNLIKNAVEHTAAGNNIRVQIEESPLLIKLTVDDDGEGIHPDDINHIFKRFYRSKYSQNKQGTGIGLTLAKTVVEMHDGFIAVESTYKKGTRFIINLPTLQNCKV